MSSGIDPLAGLPLAGSSPDDGQDGDSAWLMVFLNLLLVLLAVFIMILSFRQFKPRVEPSRTPERAARDRAERERALALKRRLSELLARNKINGALVDLHSGRPRIVLSSGVVFDPGRAELTAGARRKLAPLVEALQPLDHPLMIEGHTDDRPIRTPRFPSNWELSTARALAVVRFFIKHGVSPDRLKFVGFGPYRARASNATAQGRSLNRRIEIKVR